MCLADQDQDDSHITDFVIDLIRYKWLDLLKHDYVEVFIESVL